MSTRRFDITQNLRTVTSDASLLYVSSAKYGGDWHSSPHSHQCTELFYVVGGMGGFLIENEVLQVKAHDLVVVNPNVQHTETSLNSSPLEYIVVGFQGLELSVENNNRYFFMNFKDLGPTVLNCMQTMVNEVEEKKPGFDSVCQNLLQVLIVHLMRQTNISSPERTVQATRRECATAKWYMDVHFKERITLDSLAEVAGVNKFYLAHSFAQEYGISPIKYLNRKRIEESKYLIRSTDLPQARIAQMLGFSSSSYFAQIFHKAVGVSPSEFREMGKRMIT